MAISLIICSRNRRERLARCLACLPHATMQRNAVELVLVDSASEDGSSEVMRDFARRAPFPVRLFRAARPGLGLARNHGITAASGDVVTFTDDDCYLAEDYFDRLGEALADPEVGYGGGSILLFDPEDALVGITSYERRRVLPPGSLLAVGTVQGANMFFRRAVFAKVGGFRPDLGAGTEFPIEDIEMATRASLGGFRGLLLPELKVFHHHGRRFGTPEFFETLAGYQRGTGAYYAILLAARNVAAWPHWAEETVNRLATCPAPALAGLVECLQRELRGAADYLERLLREGGGDLGGPS